MSEITLALAGDTMLGRLVNKAMLRYGPAYPWGNILSELEQADLRLFNLECVIARGGRPWARWPKVFHFRADPIAIEALRLARADGVILSNNHVLDYEEDAFLEMLDLLGQAGITYIGAGHTLAEARQPAIFQVGNMRIGVYAFTDNEPGWAGTGSTPGTNWLPVNLEQHSLEPVCAGIASARSLGAQIVIVTAHWGPNMQLHPSPLFQAFAHAVIDCGADAFYGHSAHVMQGIEIYKGCPLIYDAGDFVDDYAVDTELRNDWAALFRLYIANNRIRQLELLPLFISDCQVNLATGAEQEAIIQRISRLSEAFGTSVRQSGDRVFIGCN